MGDRAEGWRKEKTAFIGEPAEFPVIAQRLAVKTGSRLVMALTARIGIMTFTQKSWDLTAEAESEAAYLTLNDDQKAKRLLELYIRHIET